MAMLNTLRRVVMKTIHLTTHLITALAIATASDAPSDMRRFADFPETTIEYYTVTAATASELRDQMLRRGPNHGGANNATARAYYTFDWSATNGGPKPCTATVQLRTRVRFPRHANPAKLSPLMRAEWNRFISDLEHHELGHVELAYKALPKIKAAIERGPCPGAERRVNTVDAELRRKQEAFDANSENRVLGIRELG